MNTREKKHQKNTAKNSLFSMNCFGKYIMYYSKVSAKKLVQHQKGTPKPIYLGIKSSQGSYA